jgi:hypothetical protein
MQAPAGGLLATAAACVVLAPASLAARHAPRAVVVRTTVSGEITKLGPATIAIGRVGCAIPPRLEASAGRFVVSDPVRITCLDGKLRSVSYSPELATAQTTRPGGGNAPTTVASPPPASPPHGGSMVYSIGVAFLGGPPPGDTATVTGTIDDLTTTAVTVAGLTCSFRLLPSVGPLGGPMVGDDVTLTCTGGQLIHMASMGAVTRS